MFSNIFHFEERKKEIIIKVYAVIIIAILVANGNHGKTAQQFACLKSDSTKSGLVPLVLSVQQMGFMSFPVRDFSCRSVTSSSMDGNG